MVNNFSTGNRKTCLRIGLLWLSVLASSTTSVYVDKGNPYRDHPLPTDSFFVDKTKEHTPLHSDVFYPSVPGAYSVYFFIPGFRGEIPAELYSVHLRGIASHGYVVIGTDSIWPAASAPQHPLHSSDRGAQSEPDTYMRQLEWMRTHLPEMISSKHPGVVPAFRFLAAGSHSAGGDVIYKMMLKNNTLFKTSVFLEPFSFDVTRNMSFRLPALMYGTQLAEQHAPLLPPCSQPGKDFRTFYNHWTAPRIMVYVKGFGHCDILDPVGWEACHLSGFCLTNSHNNRTLYHTYTQGVVAAFLTSTVNHYNTSLQYVTDRSLVPVTYLDLQVDWN